MRKSLLLFTLGLPIATLQAQEYLPLQVVSGYNADVIANGVGPALLSTTNTFDSFEFVLLSADYQLQATDPTNAFGLNPSGTITSAYTPGLDYQLGPFSGDNSLRLEFESDMGQLVIGNAVSATSIYVLASCGNGAGTLGGTIHFSDNSTQPISEGVIPDWFFSSALPVASSGFGRIGRDTDMVENPTDNPRFYQYQIAILAENQTKTITSIDFVKLSAPEAVINVMAVSAKELGTCPAPNNLIINDVTNNGFTASWDEPVIVPSLGYQYYISPSQVPPTSSSSPSGDLTAGVTTFTINSLSTGQQYCIWVRSVCEGSIPGPWGEPVCVTPGQIDVTNPNDIPTLFSDVVNLDSITTCPGTLTLSVPPGYQIASVATSYDMQTALNGWMSEQRSILVCNTTGLKESEIAAGVGGTTGTYSYERNGLNIADGATGNVEFELRAWRTYGSSDCNTDYNRVVAGTWTVTATLEPLLGVKEFSADNFTVYPNPANDILNISSTQIISEVKLSNMLGQQILQQNGLNSKDVLLDIANVPSGRYFVTITSGSGVQTKGVVKN